MPCVRVFKSGAADRDRTDDLTHTRGMRYQLCHSSKKLVLDIRFERMTYRLQGDCTTPVLIQLY